jgi:hypothetical protein
MRPRVHPIRSRRWRALCWVLTDQSIYIALGALAGMWLYLSKEKVQL